MPFPEDAADDPSTVAYDRQLVPWLFQHWAEPFIALAAPPASARFLDLACGSGLITRNLVIRLDRLGRIDAVDIDPAAVLTLMSAAVMPLTLLLKVQQARLPKRRDWGRPTPWTVLRESSGFLDLTDHDESRLIGWAGASAPVQRPFPTIAPACVSCRSLRG